MLLKLSVFSWHSPVSYRYYGAENSGHYPNTLIGLLLCACRNANSHPESRQHERKASSRTRTTLCDPSQLRTLSASICFELGQKFSAPSDCLFLP